MKTPKVLTNVEQEASHQLGLMLRAVKKQVKRLMPSATKPRPETIERQYIRAAEETIASAEKIIAKLKPRIAAAKRALAGQSSGSARRKKRAAKAVKAKRRIPGTVRKKRRA